MSASEIAIALAAYRPDPTLFAQQLASLVSQSFRDWVCIVTLDSPLAPLREAPQLAPYFDDPRFVWEENPARLGHKRNFQHAIARSVAAGATWIACCDQDDVWYPDKLAISRARIAALPPLSLVHCDMHALRGAETDRDTVWQTERRGVAHARPWQLLMRNVVTGCAMLFDAELARRYPEIPEGMAFHDYWYALVAAAHGGAYPIHTPLLAYRQHAINVVGVTPFQSGAALARELGVRDLLKRGLSNWELSTRLFEACCAGSLPLSRIERALFTSRADLGAAFALAALVYLRSDPKLAKACIGRGLGKLLATLHVSPERVESCLAPRSRAT